MVWWFHSTFFFMFFVSNFFFCVTKCRTLTRSRRERCTRVAFKNKISFTRSLLFGYVWPMPWLTSFFCVPSWVEHKREDGKSLLTPVRNAIFDSSFGLAQWEEEKKLSQAMECRVLIDNIHRDQRAINHGWRRATNNTKIPSSQVFRVNHRPSTLFMFSFSIVSFDYKQGSAHTQFTNWIIKFHIYIFFRGSHSGGRGAVKWEQKPEAHQSAEERFFYFDFFSSVLYGERWWCCVV